MFRKTGLGVGSLLLLAVLSTPAQASASSQAGGLQPVVDCARQDTLTISYDFGELHMRGVRVSGRCLVEITAEGELAEDPTPQRYRCEPDALMRLPAQVWDENANPPPLAALAALPGCEPVEPIRRRAP